MRIERKESILSEFQGKTEFDFQLVEPVFHMIGAVSLWLTIRQIITIGMDNHYDYVLICEDDHHFTENYSRGFFFNCLDQANRAGADTLAGGIHWLNNALQISDDISWVETFTGAQFIVIFRRFFQKIMEAEFNDFDAADLKISSISDRNFFISPFISVQKDFGYSDVTAKNNQVSGVMKQLFEKSSACIQTLKNVNKFYQLTEPAEILIDQYRDVVIPVYAIEVNRGGEISGISL